MSKIQTTTLPGGLRVITEKVMDIDSVAVGIWVDAGTRDEEMIHNGAAHMVEHMLFKGTKRRGPQDIAIAVENVGGNINAYTSREVTSYHISLMKDDLPLALDILADMYQDSTMPPDEIERERQVIIQEIGMALDTPDELVFDNYYETAYPGQALGAPILGKEDIIAGMPRAALSAHIHKFYTPAHTVISAAGDLDHEKFVAQVVSLFSRLPQDEKVAKVPALYKGGENRMEKDLEQSHFVLGFEGVSRTDEDYYSAQALATLLGGGMSSRLFQEIREKRGLVYSIFSFHSGYRDSGQFGIYAGTGPDKLAEVIPIVCDEICNVCESITEEELMRAKAQLKSGLVIGRESMMTRADLQAKFLLYRSRPLDIDALLVQLDATSVDSVRETARRIFASMPTLASLGALKTLEDFETTRRRLA
jgi:predicted Zn-dependent peptidase